MQKKVRVLVIGAGPAGLSTLKALTLLQPKTEYEIVCIQKQSTEGGQWNYSNENDIDKYGEHIHSSMYSQLWTNSPKQCFQFHDYTLKEHFIKPVPSYLPREIFKGYFMQRFEKYDLKRFIKFNSVVRNVHFNDHNSKFQVIYKNLVEGSQCFELFDFVIVATGHFSYPNIPKIQGIQNFNGKIIHSHSIRQCNLFKDKQILIIGGNVSAEDLTIQCYKYGAKSIIWNYKKLKIPYVQKNLPQNIEMIEGIVQNIDQNKAYFLNGQERDIDIVIYATGYQHKFDFLEEQLQLKTSNVLYPANLYKGVAWDYNPRLLYVGMGNYIMCQSISQVQGFFVKDIISGKHRVTCKSTQQQTDIKRQEEMYRCQTIQDCLKSQAAYILELIQLTGYPKIDPHRTIPLFLHNNKNRESNILTYRDVGTFSSIYSGQQSCRAKKPWLEMKSVQPSDPDSEKTLNQYFQF